MSASDALGPQFVHHSELAKMYSGDYDVPMSHFYAEADELWGQGGLSPERAASYEEHGGPRGYVTHLAKDIKKRGMQEPIEVRNGNVIPEGHHRALAAMQLRMARVPVYHTR